MASKDPYKEAEELLEYLTCEELLKIERLARTKRKLNAKALRLRKGDRVRLELETKGESWRWGRFSFASVDVPDGEYVIVRRLKEQFFIAAAWDGGHSVKHIYAIPAGTRYLRLVSRGEQVKGIRLGKRA